MSLARDIKQKAHRLGFDLAGITDASPLNADQIELLAHWLDAGYAGQMSYMQRNFENRIDPAKLLKNAQSLIVVGLNYTPPFRRSSPVLYLTSDRARITAPTGRVANYAQYEDYHIFIKKQLRKLIEFISSVTGGGFSFRICVDSAPLAERALAARTGVGFIGKNHMLINPELGSQILLGEIITSLKLKPDEPIATKCAHCNKCISACPTGALGSDGQFDANKCISYLTIEYKDKIPPELARKIGDRVFGCDECILACPYQENAPACKNKQFKFYSNRARLDLRRIVNLTQEEFASEFADSPVKRLGLEGLKRNAQICLANITSASCYPERSVD